MKHYPLYEVVKLKPSKEPHAYRRHYIAVEQTPSRNYFLHATKGWRSEAR